MIVKLEQSYDTRIGEGGAAPTSRSEPLLPEMTSLPERPKTRSLRFLDILASSTCSARSAGN
jgi:hypothetical protein